MQNVKYEPILAIMDTLHDALDELMNLSEEERNVVCADIADAISAVQMEVFGHEQTELIDTGSLQGKEPDVMIEQVGGWLEQVRGLIEARGQAANSVEDEFMRIIDCAKFVPEDVLVRYAIASLAKEPETYQRHIIGFHTLTPHFWGTLSPAQGDFTAAENRMQMLKQHYEDFVWLFDRLCDYRSKRTLVGFLRYWMSFSVIELHMVQERVFRDYFDMDVMTFDGNEVIVDAGAYVGDTLKEYVENFFQYKKAYCFEASPTNYEKMQELIGDYPNVFLINKAVGEKADTICLKYDEEPNVAVSMMGAAEEMTKEAWIDVVSIDEYVKEKVDVIKMDIEGAEQAALRGCERHIREEHPKLLISVYHNNEDIWKAARMIYEMDPSYRFYLRGHATLCEPTDFLLYAL